MRLSNLRSASLLVTLACSLGVAVTACGGSDDAGAGGTDTGSGGDGAGGDGAGGASTAGSGGDSTGSGGDPTGSGGDPTGSGGDSTGSGGETTGSGGASTDDAGTETDAGGGESDAGSDAGEPGCESGYQDEDGDGTCELACDATGADALDCGANGVCAISDAGTRFCACDPGFVGDTCADAFEPGTQTLRLWLDASATGTLSISGDYVANWRDRRGSGIQTVTQGTADLRPMWDSSGMNGLRTVVFDGTNDSLDTPDHFAALAGNDYTILMAAAPVNSSTFPQFLVLAQYVDKPLASVRFGRVNTSSYRFLHRANGTGDSLDLTSFTDTTEPKVIVARRWASLTTPEITYRASDNGALGAKVDVLAPSSEENLSAVAGGGNLIFKLGAGSFQGHIGEVLVYERALDDDEVADVEAYLANKWGI